ncbi:hypothetical protein GCK72_004552 [Caenorhabditis remanei]|uniref:Domain of unknown function WSN domain-containing protein n=1 Tax=Caenorhabditis remanei TaxID=31234 RepID=A0A6A5HDZ2_CAERE|nr:hypothetical protein GCK72_004552 [Caenorhabditis remanei]KAF1764603.1 hypothetical protein GCK72_004552 [Caenorhabditis remanei]
MWKYSIVTLLLLSFQPVSAGTSSLKAIHIQIREISQLAEDFHLKSELLNEKISTTDVVKVFFPGFPYFSDGLNDVEIFNGMEGQKEVVDLMKYVKTAEISKETMMEIMNGFEVLEELVGLKPQIDFGPRKDLDDLLKRLKNFGKTDFKNITTSIGLMMFDQRFPDFLQDLKGRLEKLLSSRQPTSAQIEHVIGFALALMDRAVVRIPIHYEIAGFLHRNVTFNPVVKMFNATKLLSGKMNKINILKEFSEKLNVIYNEMKFWAELESDKNIYNTEQLWSRIQKDMNPLKSFKTPTKGFKKFESIDNWMSHRMTKFASHMKTFEWKYSMFSKEIQSFFDTTKNMIEFVKNGEQLFARMCLEDYDFSTDFSKDETELRSLEPHLTTYFLESLNLEKELDRLKKFVNFTDFQMYKKSGLSDSEIREAVEKMKKIDLSEFDVILKHIKPNNQSYMMFETIKRKEHDAMKKFAEANGNEFLEKVLEELTTLQTFLNCTHLEEAVSIMKPLIDTFVKIGYVDANLAFSGMAYTVFMFREGNELVEEINGWKPESDPYIESFPLNNDDLKGISDGIEAIESIRKVQESWEELIDLDDSEMSESDGWKAIHDFITNFVGKLSTMDFNLELSNLQEFLATVSFPEDTQIDSFEKFIKEEYEGNQYFDILSFIKNLRGLKNGFSNLLVQLKNMTEGVRKYKEWENTKKKSEKKEFVDCSQSYEGPCSIPLTLPKADPDVPVKKFEL